MENMYISVADSRLSKNWKTVQITWNDLIKRLSKPTVTQETINEYKNMSKAEQGNKKDVGGFVGGKLKDGRRTNSSIIDRSIVTLDADFGGKDFVEVVKKSKVGMYDYIIYSTHSHYEGNERYRLIVRLSRAVTPDEYQAIARRIAEMVGIERFDDSTYEPARLMYWSSVALDGEFVFKEMSLMGGIDVDNILASYTDWRNVTEWPTSSRVDKVRVTQMKQQDPDTKKGIIGAFCRNFTIEDVIDKFLPDIYTQSDMANRYTYTGGSSANGLVVYDGKFAYSNHATDPAAGRLCNAFDLVRIHKFGHLDEDTKENTPPNRLPSYLAVQEFLIKDNDVGRAIFAEKNEKAAETFGDLDLTDDENSWVDSLAVDKNDRAIGSIDNCMIILENDPRIKGLCLRDEFDEYMKLTRDAPWRKRGSNEFWGDGDVGGLKWFFEKCYGITTASKITDAFEVFMCRNARHPVREYLEPLIWDGVPRLDNLLIDYLGAADTEYVRSVTRKSLTAAVARIYQPGRKFDNMLVIIGDQGIGKSTIIKKLAGDWHSDSLTGVQGKEAAEQLQGAWIVEMGELTALRRSEVEFVKQFLSKTDDRYRAAYAHYVGVRKRQCIFIGTTNDKTFLKDTTGNRRFWIVDTTSSAATKSVFKDLSQEEVDQIWAEAKTYYEKGEELYLSYELEQEAGAKRMEHLEEYANAGRIRKYLNMWVPSDWSTKSQIDRQAYYNKYDEDITDKKGCSPIDRVCAAMIWDEVLNGEGKTLDRRTGKEINDTIRMTDNWEYKSNIKFGKEYGHTSGYRRKDGADDIKDPFDD